MQICTDNYGISIHNCIPTVNDKFEKHFRVIPHIADYQLLLRHPIPLTTKSSGHKNAGTHILCYVEKKSLVSFIFQHTPTVNDVIIEFEKLANRNVRCRALT